MEPKEPKTPPHVDRGVDAQALGVQLVAPRFPIRVDLVAAQRRFVNGVLQPVHDVLSAAMKRGALPAAVDVESASARLAGPLFLQHVMLRTTISEALTRETVTQFLVRIRETG